MSSERRTEIDTSKPHSARMYDYYLGGKDWYPVDQEAAEKVMAVLPGARASCLANRGFMHRVVRCLAGEYGIRQFVDIGTGIPTEPNLHQVAQAVAPECRVVYADHDPVVLEYADALLRGTPEGCTTYVQADVRWDDILGAKRVRETLDLDEPVALSLNALLHFVTDEYEPYRLVASMVDRLAPGSFLALSYATAEFDSSMNKVAEVYRAEGTPLQLRPKSEVAEFFAGLELLEPGLVPIGEWRPDGEEVAAPAYGGVARKPAWTGGG
ncbi:SAM-dependent methyltransferase [Streptomyces sp. Amel2xB2]|uniref:SAM-dependent methyltransferase n=1 Tax=Streptomyces sp. Amel2xB2 TaxID=1305829 RepID=UPI000DBAC7DC|nr:SAM-dependent methyltransferase [Streptomyces sp. Amel2xB2]